MGIVLFSSGSWCVHIQGVYLDEAPNFYYKLTILGRNTNLCSVFNEFGGCCGKLCFLFYAIALHSFQEFELAVFKPFYSDAQGFSLKCQCL